MIPATELDDPQHQRYLADRAADAPALPMQPGERLIFRGGNPTFHRSRSEVYDIAVTDQALYFPLTSWAPWRNPPLHRIPFSEVHAVRLIPLRSRLWHVVRACVVSAALLSIAVFQLFDLSTRNPKAALISTAIVVLLLIILAIAISYEALVITRHRYTPLAETHSRVFSFDSPSDWSRDELAFDLRVLREALEACRSAGIPTCIDQSAASGFPP